MGNAPGLHEVSPRAPGRRRRRRYDSPLRRQRSAETRERIITAGAEILHAFPVWNWRGLTVRRVADRAGVTARTVYRHFETERELRRAVMDRLEREAGVELDNLRLEGVQKFAARILEYVSSFPFEPRTTLRDATLSNASARQHKALLAAVKSSTEGWPETDRTIAAGMLDVIWNVMSYERLVADWGLRPEEATRGVTWVIGLVEEAIRRDRRPSA
jgi:AcrR family transcriptional regulator